MPPSPAGALPGSTLTARRTPPLVTRLVSLGLALVAVAVVVSATTASGRDSTPRARTAAESADAVVVPEGQPNVLRVLSAQRVGDAIVLRVDPDGGAVRSVFVAGDAKVTAPSLTATASGAVALHRLLQAATDPEQQDRLRTLRFAVDYDEAGYVRALSETG